MTTMARADLDRIAREVTEQKKKVVIRVCLSAGGIAAGSQETYYAIRDEAKKRGLQVDLEVKRCGCAGKCAEDPLVSVEAEGMPCVTYALLKNTKVPMLFERHIVGRQIIKEWVLDKKDVMQEKIVLRNCGIVDPESIRDYIAADGYKAVARALLDRTPQDVVEQMKKSGLRGRGGAGFPTGVKWELTRNTPSDQRYIICNGDEGDPGAYMDRGVLESDPHSVLEGMIIAGYAMGASKGFYYIRAEYGLAIERVQKAIKSAYATGLLGKNILGSSFCFDLEVRLGAGAFVCGEETALIASIEGRRGYPHPRPPYPSIKGLWGHPTCINNVETLANVAPIILRGAEWFASIGYGKSRGTKVFALTGKVKNSGLIEVPMGTTLRQIIFTIGGGSSTGKRIKAVQTGGPSGGVIPEKHFDTPVSYENLQELGSIMGSGGMIVMDEDDSMVDIAKFYLGFCVDESCGKCAPCRVGGKQMLGYLEKISSGKGVLSDVAQLRKISVAMQKASLCGLGQTAPNPVLSTLRYFSDEYLALISGAKGASV